MKGKIVGIGVLVIVVGVILLVSSLVIVPFTTTEPFEVEKSGDWIDESFSVPAGQHMGKPREVSMGTKLGIYFIVTSGGNRDVDFFAVEETDYWKWRAGETVDLYLSRTRATSMSVNWTVPYNGTWFFVWDNDFSWITTKQVTAKLTHYWMETEYRDVTTHRSLIDSYYAYVGLAVIVIGAGIVVYGIVSKPKNLST